MEVMPEVPAIPYLIAPGNPATHQWRNKVGSVSYIRYVVGETYIFSQT